MTSCTYPDDFRPEIIKLKNTYSPELVSGPLPQMPKDDIEVIFRPTVIFQFPYDSPTTTLEIRNPELNDIFLFQAYRIQEYSRGDTQIVFRDPTWFKNRIYNWNFRALSRENRDAILEFCSISLGKWIKVTDFFSREFKCLLINPDNPVTQESPGCGYTWKADLQRELTT